MPSSKTVPFQDKTGSLQLVSEAFRSDVWKDVILDAMALKDR